jgi:hypothetical protein
VEVVNQVADQLHLRQRKCIAHLLQSKKLVVEEVKQDPPPVAVVVTLNTSAFSRRLRHRELTVDNGLRLSTVRSCYSSSYHQTAVDIHGVFDEKLANLLLCPQNQDRRAAVDELRQIFRSSDGAAYSSLEGISAFPKQLSFFLLMVWKLASNRFPHSYRGLHDRPYRPLVYRH